MATFVSDSCTDTPATALASHTGETGATWTIHPSFGTSNVVISDANRARGNFSGTNVYYASGSPAGGEYDVAADVILKSDDNSATAGIAGRVNTAANTMYFVRYNTNGNVWELFKSVAGTATSLGTFSQTLTVDQVYRVLLQIRDATKKVFVDGVERISSADNAITAAGKAGIRCNNSSGNTTGVHIDNFSAADPASSVDVSDVDTGSGADTASTLAAAATTGETGAGVDTPSVLAAATVTAEAGVGTETTALAASLAAAETGLGTDAASLAVVLTATDTGSAADGELALTTALADLDVGMLAEAVALAVDTVAAETGLGTEDGTLSVATEATETGIIAEAVALVAAVFAADTVTSEETAETEAGGIIPKSADDTGTAADWAGFSPRYRGMLTAPLRTPAPTRADVRYGPTRAVLVED